MIYKTMVAEVQYIAKSKLNKPSYSLVPCVNPTIEDYLQQHMNYYELMQ